MDSSRLKRKLEKEQKAELVAYEEGMVLFNDNRFLTEEDEIHAYFDNFESKEDIPEFLFVAEITRGIYLDAHQIVQDYVENYHHEDAMEVIDFLPSLQNYLDIWCKRQEITSWSECYKQKVSTNELLKLLDYKFKVDDPS